ncbi:MAG: aminotransferase [Gammaproteobacteria bacterium]|nr:MAG: aminotransferase [Gammaproteobacteria bacterium]
MTLHDFIIGFLGASVIEVIASISGFICVYLLIKRNIWNFFFGLIQVTLYVWVFYQNKLYSDTLLHVIYISLQFYGWWNWRQHKNSQQELVIEKTPLKMFISLTLLSISSTLVLGYLMDNYTDASFAYADAFTTTTSLIAQWLLTRRHLLNWSFWLAVDVVAIVIYLQKGLFPTSVLYVAFLIMATIGQYSWWQQYKRQLPENNLTKSN